MLFRIRQRKERIKTRIKTTAFCMLLGSRCFVQLRFLARTGLWLEYRCDMSLQVWQDRIRVLRNPKILSS